MGKVTEVLKESKLKGTFIQVACDVCNRENEHLIIQAVRKDGSEVIDRQFSVDWFNDYQIIQCQGCKTISFRILNWCSECIDFDSNGTSETLYPKRAIECLQLKDFHNSPRVISRIYREIIDSYNNEIYTLCAAGLRAIVEGLCANQGITDGPVEIKKIDGTKNIRRRKDLQGKISGLHEKGILTQNNSEILHEHRFLGNEAVHELHQPSSEELTLAIEIIEHTIESLYEIPQKALSLKRAKAKRKNDL